MRIIYLDGSTQQDITQLAVRNVWSGDYQQAARKLEIDVVNTPSDYYLPKIDFTTGKMLKMFDDDGEELFRGYIMDKDKTRSSQTIHITAYDGLIYFTKNKATYNFKKMTPEAIVSRVASDFGVPIGSLAQTNIEVSWLAKAEVIYDICMEAYTAAWRQNGILYIPTMTQGNLNMIEKGSEVVSVILSSDTSITDAKYTENAENIIDRVKIYDKNNYLIDTVEDTDLINAYGLFQDVYIQQQYIDARTAAKNMLLGLQQNGNVNSLGITEAITGKSVIIKEPFTGLWGKFYIDTDTHTWENGQHTMQLSVNFVNIMDKKDITNLQSNLKKIAKSSSAITVTG